MCHNNLFLYFMHVFLWVCLCALTVTVVRGWSGSQRVPLISLALLSPQSFEGLCGTRCAFVAASPALQLSRNLLPRPRRKTCKRHHTLSERQSVGSVTRRSSADAWMNYRRPKKKSFVCGSAAALVTICESLRKTSFKDICRRCTDARRWRILDLLQSLQNLEGSLKHTHKKLVFWMATESQWYFYFKRINWPSLLGFKSENFCVNQLPISRFHTNSSHCGSLGIVWKIWTSINVKIKVVIVSLWAMPWLGSLLGQKGRQSHGS